MSSYPIRRLSQHHPGLILLLALSASLPDR